MSHFLSLLLPLLSFTQLNFQEDPNSVNLRQNHENNQIKRKEIVRVLSQISLTLTEFNELWIL